MTTRKSQIRKDNVGRILLAAEKIFALKGYVGASMVDIAAEVELPKSNLHYYFSTKEALYRAVLDGLLALWKEDALCFEAYDDPQLVLSTYIRAKMMHSRQRPYGSKVWASEIMQGAPVLGEELTVWLDEWAEMKKSRLRQWISEGRIDNVDASAYLYMIWASTQHYADFDHQIAVLNQGKAVSDREFEQAVQNVTRVLLKGVGLSA